MFESWQARSLSRESRIFPPRSKSQRFLPQLDFAFLALLFRSRAKIGLPMRADRIPKGISALLSERDRSSIASIKIAPAMKQAGISFTWSLPAMSLVACGTTRPTQPIFPLTLTCTAIRAVQSARIVQRRNLTSTPSTRKSSSFRLSRLNLHLSAIKTAEAGRAIAHIKITLSYPALTKLPSSQKTILGNTSSSSARYCTKLVSAANTPLMTIPAKMSEKISARATNFAKR